MMRLARWRDDRRLATAQSSSTTTVRVDIVPAA